MKLRSFNNKEYVNLANVLFWYHVTVKKQYANFNHADKSKIFRNEVIRIPTPFGLGNLHKDNVTVSPAFSDIQLGHARHDKSEHLPLSLAKHHPESNERVYIEIDKIRPKALNQVQYLEIVYTVYCEGRSKLRNVQFSGVMFRGATPHPDVNPNSQKKTPPDPNSSLDVLVSALLANDEFKDGVKKITNEKP